MTLVWRQHKACAKDALRAIADTYRESESFTTADVFAHRTVASESRIRDILHELVEKGYLRARMVPAQRRYYLFSEGKRLSRNDLIAIIDA